MQVIEKVKVVPEGYNGAGMDGMYGRRDVNGKANAGLTLGIIGTALGAWALFGNRRSAGVLGTGAGLMGDGSTNINVVGVGGGNGTAPTAFQAWAKSCEDTLALQGGLYQWALNQQNQRFQDRQVIDGEMFGLYKSQIDADFSLYKGQRDNYDALKTQIEELKTQVAVGAAIRPYQDKLIQCEIERAFTAGINYVDKKTCNVILSGDPLFNSGNLSEQIQYLEEQKRIIDARQKQLQQVANGQQVLPTQQQPQVSVWDLIDSEIEPLTTEQRNMLANNEEYVNNYNSLQAMVQTEVLNLVRAKIEGSPEGKALLDSQLKLVKNLKTSIIEMSQREMQLFNAFKEASATCNY